MLIFAHFVAVACFLTCDVFTLSRITSRLFISRNFIVSEVLTCFLDFFVRWLRLNSPGSCVAHPPSLFFHHALGLGDVLVLFPTLITLSSGYPRKISHPERNFSVSLSHTGLRKEFFRVISRLPRRSLLSLSLTLCFQGQL